MVGDSFKRLLNFGVCFLAGLAFFFIPIGRKTGAQHAVAIFSTPPAKEAATALAGVARRLAAQVAVEVERLRAVHGGDARVPKAPAGAAPRAAPAAGDRGG